MDDVTLRNQIVAVLKDEKGSAIGKHVFYLPNWIIPVIAEILLPVIHRYCLAQAMAKPDQP